MQPSEGVYEPGVSYDSKPCYLVGQRGDDGLLFCPLQPPPWKRIVKLNDPQLKREGVPESIFTPLEERRTQAVQPAPRPARLSGEEPGRR